MIPPTLIAIDQVNLGASPQARHQIHMDAVEKYKEGLLRGDVLPPIDLYRDLLNNHYLIGNGFHRVLAHQAAGRTTVLARVHDGGIAEATLLAVRANTEKEHGLKRSQEDARKAVELFLLFPGWSKQSDREVGRACEVDGKTVAPIRARLETEGKIKKSETRIGGDHRERSVTVASTAEFRSSGEAQPALALNFTEPTRKSSGELSSPEVINSNEKEGTHPQTLTPGESAGGLGFAGSRPLVAEPATPSDSVDGEAVASTYDGNGPLLPRPRVEAKKIPAGLCQYPGGCTAKAFGDGVFCFEHAPVDQAAIERAVETSMARTEAAPAEISSGTRKAIKRVKCVCPSCNGKGQMGISEKYNCLLCKGAGFLVLLPVPGENGNGPSFQGYCTPRHIADAIRLVEDIGLDPTHNPWSVLDAAYVIDESQDSLSSLWPWAQLTGKKAIVLNPPWNNMLPFVEKLLGEVAFGASAFLIGPAGNPSSRWWQKAARSCAVRCDFFERVCYLKDGVVDPSPRDSTVLFYYGKNVARFCAVFGRLGLISRVVPEGEYGTAVETLRAEEFAGRQPVLPFLTAAPQATKGFRIIVDGKERWTQKKITTVDELTAELNVERLYWQDADNSWALLSGDLILDDKTWGVEDVFSSFDPGLLLVDTAPTPEPKEPVLAGKKESGFLSRHREYLEACTTQEEVDAIWHDRKSQAKPGEEYEVFEALWLFLRHQRPLAAKLLPTPEETVPSLDLALRPEILAPGEEPDLPLCPKCAPDFPGPEKSDTIETPKEEAAEVPRETQVSPWVSRALHELAKQPLADFEKYYFWLLSQAQSPEEKEALRAGMPEVRRRRELMEAGVPGSPQYLCLHCGDDAVAFATRGELFEHKERRHKEEFLRDSASVGMICLHKFGKPREDIFVSFSSHSGSKLADALDVALRYYDVYLDGRIVESKKVYEIKSQTLWAYPKQQNASIKIKIRVQTVAGYKSRSLICGVSLTDEPQEVWVGVSEARSLSKNPRLITCVLGDEPESKTLTMSFLDDRKGGDL